MEAVIKKYGDAQVLIQEGRQNEAIETLEHLLALEPDHAAAHNDLGVLFAMEDRAETARFHYGKAVYLEPENSIFQKNLAGFLTRQSNGLEEAMGLYVKLLEKDPKDVEVLLIMGKICLMLDRRGDAKVFFEKVLEIEPWNAGAWEGLEEAGKGRTEDGGQRVEDRKQTTEMDDALKIRPQFPAEELDPGSREGVAQGGKNEADAEPEELYRKIQELIGSGDNEAAVNALKEMLETYPDHAAAHNDLGALCAAIGDWKEALLHHEKAAALQPENIIFQKNLAGLCLRQPDGLEKAIATYLEILKINPSDIETLLIMGFICLNSEKYEDAKVFFKTVLDLEPWNAEASEGLQQADTL